MSIKQTAEQQEETELFYNEAIDDLKRLFSEKPCPDRNRRIKDKLEEMVDNLDLLPMK